MFTRLTPVSIVLIAMIGAVAAANNVCTLPGLVCCEDAANVSCGCAAVEPC